MENKDADQLAQDVALDKTSARGRVDCTYALHELEADEQETVNALTAFADRHLRVAPNHGFNTRGELCGFRLRCQPNDSASAVPVHRNMFHGVSVAEVSLSSSTNGEGGLHMHAVELFTNFERTRATMLDFMHQVKERSKKHEASLQYAPVHSEKAMSMKSHGKDSVYMTRVRDSGHWTPDCPSSIGLYHGFVRQPGQNTREHRVYIVCAGGLRRACDEFMNMSLDVSQTTTTAGEFCDSEEVWWLRKACSRMRAELIAQCATAFNIPISVHEDAHDFQGNRVLAQVSTETLHHDMFRLRDKSVGCFNSCVDPSMPRNGLLMACAPTEGYVLFRGNGRSNGSRIDYGGGFGCPRTCGIFPTITETRAPTHRDLRAKQRLLARDSAKSAAFVRLSEEQPKDRYFTRVDESFMRMLETMQWSRDHGVVELIPIVVGLFD